MHELAEWNAQRFLAFADRVFGDRLVGFYVVGSAALGGFVPDRSDLDFIAVIEPPAEGDCRRARLAQIVSGARTSVPAFLRGRTAGPGSCNGVYIGQDQLRRPVTQITPIASHHGISFDVISKQQAGEYALSVFDSEWHPIIEEAVAYWHGEPAHPAFPDTKTRHRRSGEFALHVIDSANAL